MKILIVSQYFWPENFRINDLSQEWVQRGHEVTVLTGIPNYPAGTVFEAYQNNPERFSSYEGANILRAPMLPRGTGAARLFLNYLSFVIGATWAGITKLHRAEFDVIFVFEPSPVTVGLPAIAMGKMKKAPVVFWALDLWPETLAAIGVIKSPKALAAVGAMVRFIYNRCTLVLGQSKGFLINIQKYCSDKAKVRYFPSWAEAVFQDRSAQLAPEIEHRPDLFNVLFAGNIGEAQDMPAILDAAEALKNAPHVRWLIVGDGRKSEWLAEEVKRRGLEERVLLLGRFPVERMPSFYMHADALLASLKQDPVFSMTIPGKVQSYLMAGIPLLGMLDGEGATVIKDAEAGLTCPAGDGKALAVAVEKLAAMSPEQRQQLGKNGLTYAQKEFGREQLMEKLEAMLRDAIASYRMETKT